MGLVAFDSNCSIWGIKKIATQGQEVNIKDATDLIGVLNQNQYRILIPSPVISELLSPINDKAERIRLYNDIRKKFHVGDFNPKASLILSDILNHHYTTNNNSYKDLGISKRCLKYDAYIIAIALAHDAECIFSTDNDFRTIAAHFISIKGLRDRPDSLPPQTFMGITVD